jgi:hypothetical protein
LCNRKLGCLLGNWNGTELRVLARNDVCPQRRAVHHIAVVVCLVNATLGICIRNHKVSAATCNESSLSLQPWLAWLLGFHFPRDWDGGRTVDSFAGVNLHTVLNRVRALEPDRSDSGPPSLFLGIASVRHQDKVREPTEKKQRESNILFLPRR